MGSERVTLIILSLVMVNECIQANKENPSTSNPDEAETIEQIELLMSKQKELDDQSEVYSNQLELSSCTTNEDCPSDSILNYTLLCDTQINYCMCKFKEDISTKPVFYSNGTCFFHLNQSRIITYYPLSSVHGKNCTTNEDCKTNSSNYGNDQSTIEWKNFTCETVTKTCQCSSEQGIAPFLSCGEYIMVTIENESVDASSFRTLKWLFIFFIVAYPILTALYAILDKDRESCWIVEKIISICTNCTKRKRRLKNRRNTRSDLYSSNSNDESFSLQSESEIL